MQPTKPYPCTPEKFAALPAEVIAAGGKVVYPDPANKNHGTLNPPKHPEVELDVVYNGTDTLLVTILDEAWYETAGEVWDGLAPYLT